MNHDPKNVKNYMRAITEAAHFFIEKLEELECLPPAIDAPSFVDLMLQSCVTFTCGTMKSILDITNMDLPDLFLPFVKSLSDKLGIGFNMIKADSVEEALEKIDEIKNFKVTKH